MLASFRSSNICRKIWNTPWAGWGMEQRNTRLQGLRFHSTFADLGYIRAIFQELKEAGVNEVSSWPYLPGSKGAVTACCCDMCRE